jgi:hypothetical protein
MLKRVQHDDLENSGLSSLILYIAVQHEALSTSGVNGLDECRGPGPRLDRFASQFTRGAF